jgi:hypothetical protein
MLSSLLALLCERVFQKVLLDSYVEEVYMSDIFAIDVAFHLYMVIN